jgi:hypothetical protein
MHTIQNDITIDKEPIVIRPGAIMAKGTLKYLVSFKIYKILIMGRMEKSIKIKSISRKINNGLFSTTIFSIVDKRWLPCKYGFILDVFANPWYFILTGNSMILNPRFKAARFPLFRLFLTTFTLFDKACL